MSRFLIHFNRFQIFLPWYSADKKEGLKVTFPAARRHDDRQRLMIRFTWSIAPARRQPSKGDPLQAIPAAPIPGTAAGQPRQAPAVPDLHLDLASIGSNRRKTLQ